jgi:hypothetical protein
MSLPSCVARVADGTNKRRRTARPKSRKERGRMPVAMRDVLPLTRCRRVDGMRFALSSCVHQYAKRKGLLCRLSVDQALDEEQCIHLPLTLSSPRSMLIRLRIAAAQRQLDGIAGRIVDRRVKGHYWVCPDRGCSSLGIAADAFLGRWPDRRRHAIRLFLRSRYDCRCV